MYAAGEIAMAVCVCVCDINNCINSIIYTVTY